MLHSQYRTSVTKICAAGEMNCRSHTKSDVVELDYEEDEECEENRDLGDEDNLDDSDDETSRIDTCDIMSVVESLQAIIRGQKEMCQIKFLVEFMASNVPDGTPKSENQGRKRRKKISKTKSSYKHSATMYYS